MTQYDKNNVPLFESGVDNHFLCSCCGQYTTRKDSVSHKGYNLICNRCFYKITAILDLQHSETMRAIQHNGERKEREVLARNQDKERNKTT